jgi:hypothetical protein
MDTTTWIIVAVAVAAALIIIGLIAWSISNRRRDERLQRNFGREYDETYATTGDRKAALQNLKQREERVSSYDLRPLEPEQRRQFLMEWQNMQASFVDDPIDAVSRADNPLADVMRARGYETDLSDPNARLEDISVGHGDEAVAFREANRVAALNREGRATTEDLRRAIKDYGTVFDSLLNERQAAT